MWWLLWVALAATGLYALHRLALWAESRGWVYYRQERMPPGATGMALLEVTSLLNRAAGHVIEETRGEQARAQTDESGAGSGEPPR